ncbi:MAG: RDD family protein [Bacteroidetes bacterium]|nr:RDD family protein [Bacteroidota bacterium]
MKKVQIPIKLHGIDEDIYAGFWIRFASLLLDFAIVSPFVTIIILLNALSKNIFFYTLIPNLLIGLIYNVYFVQKWGGTPGKLIVGIKILKTNGEDIKWREAILRYFVLFSLLIFGSIVMAINVSNIDNNYYESLNWINKQRYMGEISPTLNKINLWLTNIWTYSELIVLLMNSRKRALHDFIAGTVIVKKKYVDEIRKAIQNEKE